MYPSFFSCLSVLQVCLSATDSTIILVERQLVYFCLFFFFEIPLPLFFVLQRFFLQVSTAMFTVWSLRFSLAIDLFLFFFSSFQVISLFVRLISTAVHASFRKSEKKKKKERKEREKKRNVMTMH